MFNASRNSLAVWQNEMSSSIGNDLGARNNSTHRPGPSVRYIVGAGGGLAILSPGDNNDCPKVGLLYLYYVGHCLLPDV
jgi:hypothetical protein